jgi:DNA ligase-associated metallophosphoesterase
LVPLAAPLPEGVLALNWAGETLWLSPWRTAYLPAHATLLVADFHLGKAHSFRRLGVPVPGGTTMAMLARLDEELRRFEPRRLVFLGDFLHAAAAQASPAAATFAQWRAQRPELALTLVRGNHDQRAGDPPPSLRIQCVDEPWALGTLALCHHPAQRPGLAVVAGHLHPAAVVRARAHDHLRLPCFALWPDRLVLPAFGGFTGQHTLPREAGLQCWVTDGTQVFRLP